MKCYELIRRVNFIRAVACVAFLVYGTNADCQKARFKHYSSDEGFTGAAFKVMSQDSLGYLWISSVNGIFKFDGYEFVRYKQKMFETLALIQGGGRGLGNIRFLNDPSGELWVGFRNKIARFDRDMDAFVSFEFHDQSVIIDAMSFERTNEVWVGTAEHGLLHINLPEFKVNYVVDHNSHASPASNKIRSIANAGASLILGTQHGIWLYKKEDQKFSRPRCDPADSSIILNGDVKEIFMHKEHLWLWVDDALVKVSRNFSVLQKLDFEIVHQNFDHAKRFVDSRVASIAEDRNEKFWIATQGLGLIFFDPSDGKLENFRYDAKDPESLPSDVLHHVMLDRDDNVWVTTVNKGIAQLKKPGIVFHNYLPGLSSTGIDVIQDAGRNYVLVGTNGASIWKADFDDRNLSNMDFRRLEIHPLIRGFENVVEMTAKNKNVWVGTMQAGVAGLQTKDVLNGKAQSVMVIDQDAGVDKRISANFIASLWEDRDGDLWIGTIASGLNFIDLNKYGEKGSVIVYQNDPKDPTSIAQNGIPDIREDDDGSLLIATFLGLDRIVKPKEPGRKIIFEHLVPDVYCNRIYKSLDGSLLVGTKLGLFVGRKTGGRYEFTKAPLPGDPNITCIEEDRLGRLWMMSLEGLYFYDRKTNFVLILKKEDGLPSSRSVMAAEAFQTRGGTMIFSNGEGVTLFDPMSIAINDTKPRPNITNLRINNKVASATHAEGDESYIPKNISTLQNLTLNYQQNIIVIEFSGMDYTAPEKNKYMYTLEGFDKTWAQTDWKNRTATYTNLEPGNYVFKVKASNRDGIWSDHVKTLSITVLPPPWKTWWAYSLYGIALAGILFAARRNIIKQERLAATLKVEHLELEKTIEVDRLRSTFFTNISHEFRTPLTLIQGPAQNLIDKLRREKQVQAREAIPQLDLILQNSNRLLRLVNQVLDLSKLESGGLKIEFMEEEVFRFLNDVVAQFTALAVQKNILLKTEFAPYSAIVRFDKDKLEKILSNLIFNALKFTPEHGKIVVTARLDDAAQSALIVKVADNGPGIALPQRERIFERFFQVSEGDHQNAGTGIGLALSKELAEFLGGSIAVESSVGLGSTFVVRVPVEVIELKNRIGLADRIFDDISLDENGKTNGLAVETAPEPLEKPLLLIVEDHADLRKFIISCLGDDYRCIEAVNGKEGFRLTLEQLPTLILSDIMMSEMDGVEMCGRIKSDPRTSHIPVILLTARASEENKLFGLEKGADDYLVKPFNKDELILRIRNQVAAQKRIQDKIRLEILSSGSVVKATSADEKFIERVKNIIELKMSDERLSVEGIAEEIGLSRVQLYRKVSALTGIPVNEFIRKLRLKKSAQLLAQNWGPVTQVAFEVGFSNPSYFSKCFREEFGVSPSDFHVKSMNEG